MNWLGKVFVVLILIMSLVFMGLAMAVYATHKNWKDVIEGTAGSPGLRTRLQQAEQKNQELIAQHNRKVEELEGERESSEQQVRKLESERTGLVARNQGIQAELDKLNQDIAQATAAVAATQANNDKLAAEVTNLRQQIRTASKPATRRSRKRWPRPNSFISSSGSMKQLRNGCNSSPSRLPG